MTMNYIAATWTVSPVEVRQVTEPDATGNRADLAVAAIGGRCKGSTTAAR